MKYIVYIRKGQEYTLLKLDNLVVAHNRFSYIL